MAPNVIAEQVPATSAPRTLRLGSPAFEHNEAIPVKYTCEGEDVSVPLQWRDLPEGTKSLVLIVDDPDVPGPAEAVRHWVHWVLFNIPPSVSGLAEGASTALPDGVGEGSNGWKRTGYGGPCPPIGRHRYYHRLYALDTVLDDTAFGRAAPDSAGGAASEGLAAPNRGAVLAGMEGHVLAWGELMGTYKKVSP